MVDDDANTGSRQCLVHIGQLTNNGAHFDSSTT